MRSVANVYGQVLYALARDEGLSRQVHQELKGLLACLDAEPAFAQLLCTPSIPRQERCQTIDSVLGDQVHPYVLNFLKILTEKGYIRQFSDCFDAYSQQFYRENGILKVTAVTALPLSDSLRRRLADRLSLLTGKTIELDCRLDPEVLGGVCLDFGDKQVDGTLRHRLEELRRILKIANADQKAGTVWN